MNYNQNPGSNRQQFQNRLNAELNEVLNGMHEKRNEELPSSNVVPSDENTEKNGSKPVRLRFTVSDRGIKKFTIEVMCVWDGNQMVYIPGSVRDAAS